MVCKARHCLKKGAARYYNAICMLKRRLLLFRCVWKCECVCVCVYACVNIDVSLTGMASPAIVLGKGGCLLSIHYWLISLAEDPNAEWAAETDSLRCDNHVHTHKHIRLQAHTHTYWSTLPQRKGVTCNYRQQFGKKFLLPVISHFN